MFLQGKGQNYGALGFLDPVAKRPIQKILFVLEEKGFFNSGKIMHLI